jgi:SET domain-containing protein
MAKRVEVGEQPFVIRRSKIQGRGAYATRDIAKGERVAEYLGERISWAEADRRYDDESMRRHHTFLFTITSRTVIDGGVDGNDARFINHSCAPNCEAFDEDGRIFIYARRRIRQGEELAYDYAYPREKDPADEDESLYPCRCGAKTCRGTILEPPPRKKPRRRHHAAARHASKKRARKARG